MSRKPGRTYVEKDYRKNGAILVVVLVVTLVILALVSLMPNRAPQAGDASRIGVSRNFMFPLAYTDQGGALKVVDESLKMSAVDDSVSHTIHDFQKDKIYYVRANVLYEYDIRENNRRILVGGGVADYRVLNDRSAFVYLTTAGELHLYDYIGNTIRNLGFCGEVVAIGDLVQVGEEGFLYYGDTDPDNNVGSLYFSDNEGNSMVVSKKVELSTARISSNDKYITYKKDSCLFVVDSKGREIVTQENGSLVESVSQPLAISEKNTVSTFNEGVSISYVYGEEELLYFTGEKWKSIGENVSEIVYYGQEKNRIFYTVFDEEEGEIALMMSVKGGQGVFVTKASEDAAFIWCEEIGKIFCLEDGNLFSISVFDDFQKVSISKGVTAIKQYPGKPFLVYNDALQNNYYVLSDNTVEQVAVGAERLYGLTNNTFLLQSTYSGVHMSLDLVENDSMQRLDSDIDRLVCFDGNMDNVVYLTWEGLVLRNSEGNHLIDNAQSVTLVELKS